MKGSRILILVAIAAAVGAFFAFDLGRYLSLDFVKSQQAAISSYATQNPLAAAGAFFAVYVAVTGLSLPGAAILTLVGGAVFGLLWGTVIVSFASSIGATLAFLVSRFLLRDWVQAKFGDKLAPINAGVAKEGAFYLFALRLVPAFPFFVVNLVMGLTPIRAATFYWVSQVGMLAGTVVFVYAGTQLAQITSLRGILSPGLIGAFVLLGIFPFIAKRIVETLKARKVYARWPKPAAFDRHVVVIGAGSAGLVTSYIAAAVKAKVTLVERHKMGGDCLNTGCVPSKALIRSAKFLSHVRRAKEFGIHTASADFDFAQVMERVQSVVKAVEPHDSVDRYASLGVDCVAGTARITSPWTVEVMLEGGEKRTLTTKNIVIAAGARPFVPPIPGLLEANPLTSDTVWNLRALPERLVVLGGGPIGSELTQAFARLGSKVTQVEMLPRILIREDAEVSALVKKSFEADGVDVLVNHKAKQVLVEDGGKFLVVESEGTEKRVAFDEILVAVGRVANTTGYGLEELGIPTTKQRTVEVNEYLETLYPNIFACGDVAGPYQFTHTAAHMAWYCAVNALFGTFRKFKVDYSVIPWATFTEPEVARVGLNEQEAKEKGIAHVVTTYGIDDLDRAIADSEAHGFVKVITPPGSDKILGATIVGEHAGDLLAEFVMAMRHGIGLNKVLGTIHTYPTLAEANKYAAGVWKRGTVTRGQMDFLAAFQEWRLGKAGFGGVLGKIGALTGDKRPYYDAAASHGDD
ncbi:MAG: FAD-dependent oxidoreductase [Betaproteobacteria bacterium]|nr:FAD-dependent oxidoreductase [Betaproteobacteria bacterium]